MGGFIALGLHLHGAETVAAGADLGQAGTVAATAGHRAGTATRGTDGDDGLRARLAVLALHALKPPDLAAPVAFAALLHAKPQADPATFREARGEGGMGLRGEGLGRLGLHEAGTDRRAPGRALLAFVGVERLALEAFALARRQGADGAAAAPARRARPPEGGAVLPRVDGAEGALDLAAALAFEADALTLGRGGGRRGEEPLGDRLPGGHGQRGQKREQGGQSHGASSNP